MILGRVYQCDLCGKTFKMGYDHNLPNHITMIDYDAMASTKSNSKSEYDLCESCAHEIRKVINKIKRGDEQDA